MIEDFTKSEILKSVEPSKDDEIAVFYVFKVFKSVRCVRANVCVSKLIYKCVMCMCVALGSSIP